MQSKNYSLSLFFLTLISCFSSGNIYADVKSKLDVVSTIPFKSENTAVSEAASNIPYLFLVLFLLIFVIYFFNKKFGLFKMPSVVNNEKNTVKILQMNKITPNTVFFKIKIDDSEYMFLESKNNLKEVKPDSSTNNTT